MCPHRCVCTAPSMPALSSRHGRLQLAHESVRDKRHVQSARRQSFCKVNVVAAPLMLPDPAWPLSWHVLIRAGIKDMMARSGTDKSFPIALTLRLPKHTLRRTLRETVHSGGLLAEDKRRGGTIIRGRQDGTAPCISSQHAASPSLSLLPPACVLFGLHCLLHLGQRGFQRCGRRRC